MYRVRPFSLITSPIHIFISAFADVARSDAHGPAFVHSLGFSTFSLSMFVSIQSPWAGFLSMSLIEGKGTSCVADSLSTVHLSLLPQPALVRTFCPGSPGRRSCGAGMCF